jgi:hypothetical protein
MKEDFAFVIMIKDKWWREFCRRSGDFVYVHMYLEMPARAY